ncbi:50S ribosomal protein L20 [Planctomycetales bacterium ZRK34]|nr:50S ribosomal protein L20 [Planctomycetales bacterium ZRK34]
MPRARKGAARRQSKVRVFKAAKGFRGARSKTWRRVQESVLRAGASSYRDRRLRKRDMRRLWITRVTAAARLRDMRYSQLIAGLKAADIQLNRKMLSEIAIADPAAFDAIAEQAKAALSSKAA